MGPRPFHFAFPLPPGGLEGAPPRQHPVQTEGNNIEPQYRREGTGGKPLCAHCARLNATGQ